MKFSCKFDAPGNPSITLVNRLLACFLVTNLCSLTACTKNSGEIDQIENTLFLMNLPANRWIKYHHLKDGDWWRKGHAGMAYDSTRGGLLVFGSDTHGEDWDNVVHEFIPRQREWVHHGVNSAPNTYTVNSEGKRVAGVADLAPWAMHTYDGVEYDSLHDTLIVVASPSHNPVDKQIPGSKSNAIWLYNLKKRKWSIFEDHNRNTPSNYFGAATAYDDANERLFICTAGLWLLDMQSKNLRKIGSAPNCLHRNLALDSWRGYLYLFGSYKGTCDVSRYKAGAFLDDSAEWQEIVPTGDDCVPYSSVPVAFDEKTGVFLLVVDQPKTPEGAKARSATTLIYDPGTNTYEKLLDSHVPTVGMNFMMAWDSVHEVFFLLTGNWKNGMTVWVMRLDPSQKL